MTYVIVRMGTSLNGAGGAGAGAMPGMTQVIYSRRGMTLSSNY